MIKAMGYGTKHSFSSLVPLTFAREEGGENDIYIEILYCGVCHSDIHQAENDWGNTLYPCMPGHEIVGRVRATGAQVTRFKIGDMVGVGCMIGSCGKCDQCRSDLEQYCQGPKGATMTYNGPMKPDGTNTWGGYSNSIVVPQKFVLKIPRNLDLKAVAPLLCAGVTTYSPLRHWNVQAGQNVGIVGLGGLGHMATKLATAMGAHVTVFSRSAEKMEDAFRFGARAFTLSKDTAAMEQLELAFDFILSTIPDPHDINPYIKLLKRDGTLAVVGTLAPFTKATDNSEVAFHRRSVAGSLIGGIKETQEVLDFCGQHDLTADVELIDVRDINNAFKKIKNGDARYRYVIDIANSFKAA